jgi:hypothetical protein
MSRVTEACSDKEATHTVTWKKASQTAEDGEWGAGGPQLLQNHCSIYYFLAISLNPPPKEPGVSFHTFMPLLFPRNMSQDPSADPLHVSCLLPTPVRKGFCPLLCGMTCPILCTGTRSKPGLVQGLQRAEIPRAGVQSGDPACI